MQHAGTPRCTPANPQTSLPNGPARRACLQLLLARIGDTLMLYLLLNVSMFAALPNACCLQLRWGWAGGWLGGRVEGVQLRCGSIVFPSVAPLLQTAALPADAPCTCPPLHLPQERSCCGRFTCRT